VAKVEVSSIGKYQVVERIATGDAAEIFKARLEGIAGFRRMFAIKRVRPHLARNAAYVQMIEEEARIAGMLNHGNIVQLLDLGRDGGAVYLVMEFVDGWDLGRVLERAMDRPHEGGEGLSVSVIAHMGVQILKALEYAHRREVMRDGQPMALGLVHRDVSPSNILISRLGEVKLTDFGIARAALKMMETHPDLVRRTFDYMSPEAARGRAVTQQSDLFALGVVLYECLAGVHPFRQSGEMATLEAIQDGRHTPLDEAVPGLPPRLVAVIEAAMSVDPAARPRDATAFKDELDAVIHELGTVAPHELLATWLREAFGAPEPEAPVARRPLERIDLDLPDLPMEADETVPAPLPGFSPMPHVEEEEARTVVMGGPIKPIVPPSRDPEEGATQVNPSAAAKVEALRSAREAPESTRVRTDLSRDLAQQAAREAAAKRAAAEVSPPWVLGAVTGGLALVIGTLLGAVLTAGYVRSGGMMVNPPQLDVRADPGVKMGVIVDGVTVGQGPQQLAAGNHAVKVEVEGSAPWELDLTLQAGEYRVMVITAHKVTVSPPK
jgi:serine/threonine protein kinase